MGVVLFLCWLAAAGQVLAVISERYGPYPAPRGAPGTRADRACRRRRAKPPARRGDAVVRRPLRILGTVCAAAGILAVLWALVVWQWQDPFTALYTHQQQRRLAAAFERQANAFAADSEPTHQSSQTIRRGGGAGRAASCKALPASAGDRRRRRPPARAPARAERDRRRRHRSRLAHERAGPL